MKRVIISLTVLMFVFTSVGLALAEPDGNKRKGKYTYRKVYKACMEHGEVDSPKPVLNPDSKTQAEWTVVFNKLEFADFGCSAEWGNLGEQELLDIYTYLWSFAADSPTPAKCK